MNEVQALREARCEPCHGGTAALSVDEVEHLLGTLDGWSTPDHHRIERDLTFKDFSAALAFVNRVGALAEEHGHHPDILLWGWNRVRLTLSTHAINALSRNDFILAAQIENL